MEGLRRSLFLITLPLATFGCLVSIDTAKAQIIPDNSLGAEKSVVNTNANIDQIDGGARRGANLFHSFQEFNVGKEGKAYFSNPAGVENIFSRVTGKNPSNIFGTLGVFGNANLFFMNPNGVFFGPDARLDMRGSFLASTANSLLFDGGLEFSASNPQAPPMLTVNIPIGLQFRDNPGAITNQSVVDDVGLQVDSGKTLSLVGGDISLDRGRLTAAGGQVTLGSLAGTGTVGLNSDGSLSFPDGVARSNVSLTNGAQVDVTAGGGGSVNIYAQNLDILGNSPICAGIGATPTCGNRASDVGSVESKAGDVTLNVLGALNIQGSRVENDVNPGAIGQGGNLNIQADSISVTNGARLSSSTYGQGDAGKITINANSLSVKNGSQLSSSIFGKGNAGGAIINANDSVSFDGVDRKENPSAVLSNVEEGAVGNGGSININAGSLSLTNGGELGVIVRDASSTLAGGQGIGGNVNIKVRDAVTISGTSGIYSRLGVGAVGKGGNINIIKAGSLSVSDDAQIDASTEGKGDAGNINLQVDGSVLLAGDNTLIVSNVQDSAEGKGGNVTITADSLTVKEGAQVNAFTRGRGDAGNVTINATGAVSFDGVGISDGFPTNVASNVQERAIGNGGSININAASLSLTNGGELGVIVRDASSTLAGGQGIGGNVNIKVRDAVTISGTSGIYSRLGVGAVGKGGNINIIKAGSLSITDDAKINASTEGKGDAGNINLQVDGSVLFTGDNTLIVSNVQDSAEGKGGNVTITADSLTVKEGAQVNAFTRGRGDAGNVTINVTGAVSFDGVGISDGFPTNVASNVQERAIGNGGSININAGSLSLTNGGQLAVIVRKASSNLAGGQGIGGNVNIKVRDAVTISGKNKNTNTISGIYSSLGFGAVGKGGNINIIKAGSLSVSDDAQIDASTYGKGGAGNITATTDKDIRLDNKASIEANTVGGQGNITLRSRDLILRHNSNITTNATGSATGGNISITTDNLVALENSHISANAQKGFGGRVIINAQGIFKSKDSDITASSELGTEFSGQVTLNLANVDPSHGLVELPKNVVDPTEQIAQNPCQRGVGSRFIITGRGGLPPSPNEATSSDAVRVDLVEPAPGESGGAGEQRRSTSLRDAPRTATLSVQGTGEKGKSSVAKSIVPAQGWIFDKNGEVMLTGYDPTGTGLQRSVNSNVCPVP